MISTKISKTALGTAAGRALESSLPPGLRLFEDPWAMDLQPVFHRSIIRLLRIPVLGKALLASREKQIPGITGNLLCRTKFIDDAFQDALQDGFEQVAVLGAGLDSRSYRFPDFKGIHFFEVDHPATQGWKKNCIRRRNGKHPGNVAYVPMDFQKDDLAARLTSAGFRKNSRTLFIWEGVSQYLSNDAVDSTLRHISRVSAPGSRIIFTYISREFIENQGGSESYGRFLADLRKNNEPWIFGISTGNLGRFLEDRGLKLLADAGAPDYRKRYLEPINREMNLFESEHVAIAEIKMPSALPEGDRK